MPRFSLSSSLCCLSLLPELVSGFGGLSYLKSQVNASVEVPPGEFEPTYGWDQTNKHAPQKCFEIVRDFIMA